MYPIVLSGHDGPLTKVMYNREGDIIFSVAKFKENKQVPTAWWSDTGERLGTYDGHANGVVWDIDVTQDSAYLITASARSEIKLWNVQSGKELVGFEHHTKGAVRCVNFSPDGSFYFVITQIFGTLKKKYPKGALLSVYQTPDELFQEGEGKTTITLDPPLNECITETLIEEYGEEEAFSPEEEIEIDSGWCGSWFKFPNGRQGILVGGEDGKLRVYGWNEQTGVFMKLLEVSKHEKVINDIQFDRAGKFFVTASKDGKVKLIDSYDFKTWKVYQSDFPVNSAAIHPRFEHVIFGGGQDSKDVTTTSSDQAGFEAQFAHMIHRNIFGKVKLHFGPINSLAINPDGTSFVTAGEDGTLRLCHFTAKYMSKQSKDERKLKRWIDKYNDLKRMEGEDGEAKVAGGKR